jgi:transposase
MERRKFTREFKLEAVRLIKDRGVSYVQASQELTAQLVTDALVMAIWRRGNPPGTGFLGAETTPRKMPMSAARNGETERRP